MSQPIVEQIALAIATQIATVTTDNGYEVDVTEVLRPRTRGIDKVPDHGGVILVQDDETEAEDYSVTGNPAGIGRRRIFNVGVVIRLSDSSETSFDAISNLFVADLTKALMADVHWGGLAIDSKIGDEQPMRADDGSFEGTALPLEVIYRVAENDPYTKV